MEILKNNSFNYPNYMFYSNGNMGNKKYVMKGTLDKDGYILIHLSDYNTIKILH